MSIEIKIPKDRTKIDANNLGELVWWSHHLGIRPEKMLSIIEKVGISAKEIREYKRLNRNS